MFVPFSVLSEVVPKLWLLIATNLAFDSDGLLVQFSCGLMS